MPTIYLGDIPVEVELKEIKNIHLSVHPPMGRVRISAPSRYDLDTIRIFAISKLSWIKEQQKRLREQLREAPRDYIPRESHFFLGRRYLLKVNILDAKPNVSVNHNKLILQVRPDTSTLQRQTILREWYREQLKEIVHKLIQKWEPILNVTVNEFGVKRMKTKWGTCKADAGRIWLNLELAKKPLECVEYIVVHEMVHLLERKHNQHFIQLLEKALPHWHHLRDELNRQPISHIDWNY